MAKYYDTTEYSGSRKFSKPPRHRWRLALKICLWSITGLIVASACVFWGITAYLSPDRIAHIIEKEADKYLRAKVKIGKLDYKLWSTYPWLEFEVDSLTVVSESLDGVSRKIRAELPLNSDSLAAVNKISGKVNVHSLLHKQINLKDIEIWQPRVNIVMVNDSVANFNIAPPMKEHMKMPDIKISEINVAAPVDLSFFSLADQASAKLDVESFYYAREESGSFSVGFDGKASGAYKGFVLPGVVPVKFTAGITPHAGSLSLDLDSLSISLAGVALVAKGMLTANKNGLDFENAQLNVKIDDVFSLLSLIPSQFADRFSLPDGISGFLPVSISTSLLAPLHIPGNLPDSLSLSMLPPISLQLRIEDANIEVHPPHQKPLFADDIRLTAVSEFYPDNAESTFVEIQNFHVNGEGLSLSGTARMDNLTCEEQLFNGKLNMQSPIMETLSYIVPKAPVEIAGFLTGRIEVEGKTLNLGKEGIRDIDIKGDVRSHLLKLNSQSMGKVALKNMAGDFRAAIPRYPLTDYQGTKMGFEFKADSIAASTSGMDVKIGGIDMKLNALDTVSGSPDPSGSFFMKMNRLMFTAGQTFFNGANLSVDAKGELNSEGPPSDYTVVATDNGGDDALIASRTRHTPLVLQYSGGGILSTIIGMMDLDADINMGEGSFSSPAYLYPVDFSGVKMTTNLNRIKFSATRVKTANTGLSMSGQIDGLAPFLTSYSATPLKISADMIFSNVDINRLSWGYYGALVKQGRDSIFYVPPMLPFTASDSTAVAIPRNIDAQIKISSASAEYMGYRFAPLSTSIIVKDGNATLSKLTVGTPYATAIVDWTYSTRRLENVYMDLDAGIKNFSFARFYESFPEIMKNAAEIENLTGEISANVKCHFDMFPSMFMNPASLNAKFDVKAINMEFARKGKIEKITHLMLIEGDSPIHIQNMDINGSFHDNLLQLNPFRIAFDEYQLAVGGVLNTGGKMYYHLALEKSPFHLPFGVSLFGNLKHPEVRVGGTHIDDYRAEMVSVDNLSKLDVNIMAYLRHGWILFVQEAAKYQQKQEAIRKND